MKKSVYALLLLTALTACKKEEETFEENNGIPPQLILGVEFDESLPRLGNFGEPVAVASGNAAQHPNMNEVSLHYIEFAEDSLTQLGNGAIVYQGAETTEGGASAVDVENAIIKGNGETFINVDLKYLSPGEYNWIRVSLTYQNYDIEYRLNEPPYVENQDFTGTLSSFVGFNSYIKTHTIKDSTISVNANKEQGFWAFETGVEVNGQTFGSVRQGDGAGVTVVNPISSSSPVPAGSCVVTGKLKEPLVITGDEKTNVQVILAFSINNSFEWNEINADGKFEPGAGESVVDMGLRGLHPYVKN